MIPRNIIITARERPEAWLASLGEANPRHQTRFFDDEAARELVAQHFPGDTLEAYDKVRPKAYKADLFRYCALQVMGGIYTDVQIPYCLSFSEMWDLDQDRVYLVRDKYSDAIQVGFIACSDGSRFMQMCRQRATLNICNEHYGNSPLSVTGPTMAWQCFCEYTGLAEPELGKINPAADAACPPVHIGFQIARTDGDYRRNVAETVVIDHKKRPVFPYKLNRFREHRSEPDYYWKAWHRRKVFGEHN